LAIDFSYYQGCTFFSASISYNLLPGQLDELDRQSAYTGLLITYDCTYILTVYYVFIALETMCNVFNDMI